MLGNKLEIVEFSEMLHGWTVRGNMSDPAINRFNWHQCCGSKSYIVFGSES